MHWFFQAVRYYPFWVSPVLLIVFDLFVHFRRRKKDAQWSFLVLGVALVLLLIVWVVFRGDLHAERWILDLRRVAD